MSKWEKKQIGKYLIKEATRLADNGEKDLDVYGVSNIEGITKTGHKKSKDLSKYIVIKPGYFAYNPYRINVGSIGYTPEGINGLVSPAYVVFRTDETSLLPELLLDFLKSSDGLFEVKRHARGTVRQALRFEDLCKIEMVIPPIEEQKKIIKQRNEIHKKYHNLKSEFDYQQEYISNLRQAILQDAIQGKLTEDWRKQNPDVEPASELLKKIKAEKERLSKDPPSQSYGGTRKKIKKEKPLPPIKEEEIPFTLSKGWEWCRLGDIVNMIYGKGLTKSQRHENGEVPVYGSNGVVGYYDKYLTPKKSIIIGRKGSAGALNISVLPSWTTDVAYYVEETDNLNFMFLYYLLCGAKLSDLGKGIKPGLNRTEAYEQIVGLPSMTEQKEIVKKVDQLMKMVNDLELQIQENKTTADLLMQSVLREAFSK